MTYEIPMTVKEWFDAYFCSNFEDFKVFTGGIIYMIEKSGQMTLIFIEALEDLTKYYNKNVVQVDGCNRLIFKE